MFATCIFSFAGLAGVFLVYRAFSTHPAKAVVRAGAKNKQFTPQKRYEQLTGALARRLLRLVHISQYKQNEYRRMLEVVGQSCTPEEYTARVLAKTLLFFALALLALLAVSPPLMVLAPVVAAVIYLSGMSDLKKQYLKRRTEIELDLPKLCSVINFRLQSSANVPSILQSFLPIASPAIASEIAITLADAKTGNVETALRRFEGRMSSPKVSDVVRGLIAVQNGDDMRLMFAAKQQQFESDYLTVKKKAISMRPLKLSLPGMLLFFFFLLIILYTLSLGMQEMMSSLF